MATSVRNIRKIELCSLCSPKQVKGVTSCSGCLKSLCQKHFNEHRDVLSNELNNIFDRHDALLQELQLKLDRVHKPTDNDNARAILKRIDKWEAATIKHVSEAANDAREDVQRLFSRKRQLDQLKENVSYITKELKEQQESESFVETDIDEWIKRLEQLKTDLLRPSTFDTNPPVFDFQNIDWNTVIKISPPLRINQTSTSIARRRMNTDTATGSSVMECPVCSDEYPSSRMERMFLCDHIVCSFCMQDYYRMVIKQIRDFKSLKQLTCIVEEHEIPEDMKWDFLQYLETKFNQWFANEKNVLDTFDENVYIATQDSHNKKCANPRCLGFFYASDDNHIVPVECPHCQFEQCQRCWRKWHNEHTDMDCEEYAQWLGENDPDDPEVQLVKYLNTVSTIICPNQSCKDVYVHVAGASECFACPRCRTEFCRICSALFYNPRGNTVCPRTNCALKKSIHAHCSLNCYREIRDQPVEEIIQLLTTHKINFTKELRQKPQAIGPQCSADGCTRTVSVISENRFCEGCYKEFLCSLVWQNELEPWELYSDNNLRQNLVKASVLIPANATRANLIVLARQHLTQFLGKPKKITRTTLELQ